MQPLPTTGGLDFSPFPQSESGRVFLTALLPSNASQAGFGVVLRDDSIVEQPESFTARLQSLPATQGGGVMIGTQDTAQVLILDNDCELISVNRYTLNMIKYLTKSIEIANQYSFSSPSSLLFFLSLILISLSLYLFSLSLSLYLFLSLSLSLSLF